MIARYNNLSLALGVPGLILQIAGNVMMNSHPENPGPWFLLLLLGTVLLLVGLSLYAKAKGRSPAWGLMGFFSIIGLIVLALLKDHAPNARA